MQEKKNINLKKFHKREIQSNYLVIKSEQKFDFNDFEYKILENNNIEGLLKLKIDDESLLFDITSKQPLSLILEYKKVNQKDIKTLIFELNKVISSLSQYLLEESSLLIDMDCIYANPKDLSLEFCYIPRFSNDLYISEKGLIARYKGENVFDVTSSEPFDITLTNVGNEPVTFTAHVVYR